MCWRGRWKSERLVKRGRVEARVKNRRWSKVMVRKRNEKQMGKVKGRGRKSKRCGKTSWGKDEFRGEIKRNVGRRCQTRLEKAEKVLLM